MMEVIGEVGLTRSFMMLLAQASVRHKLEVVGGAFIGRPGPGACEGPGREMSARLLCARGGETRMRPLSSVSILE